MKVETVYGEELVLDGEPETVPDIKGAVSSKHGYPLEKIYVHKNGERYILGQFGDGEEAETACPFSRELLEYGCPGSLVESLYREGYRKEDIYEKLLPGLLEKGTPERVLEQPQIGSVLEILRRDGFNEKDLVKALEEISIDYVLENEEKYCKRILEALFEE